MLLDVFPIVYHGVYYSYAFENPVHNTYFNVLKSEGPGSPGKGAPLFSAVLPGRDGGALRETGRGGRKCAK